MCQLVMRSIKLMLCSQKIGKKGKRKTYKQTVTVSREHTEQIVHSHKVVIFAKKRNCGTR